MPPAANPHPVRVPYLERCFEISLYLLVLTGFTDLAATGELDLWSVTLVGAALIFRGYLLLTSRKVTIPERWTTILTILYALFYLSDYLLISGSFLTATIHLVLFVIVVRIFSAARDRDYYFLAVLAFAMVLAAAMLTVNSSFLASFALFLLLAVTTVVFIEMRHASAKASLLSAECADSQTFRRMSIALIAYTPVLVISILAAGSLIFFVLPRVSAGYMGTYIPRGDVSTGFTDRVELGQIGEIEQSSSVVMHIRIDGDTSGAYDLKWRGVALNHFNGKDWSNNYSQYAAEPLGNNRFQLGGPHPRDRENKAFRRRIHYRVLMEPIGTNVLFLATQPEAAQGDFRLVMTDAGGAAYDADPQHPVTIYDGWSALVGNNADDLRKAGKTYPPEIVNNYLQLPEVDPRIPHLAAEIVRGKTDNYDKAIALEEYLRTKFGYTLQLPSSTPADPLADFLFRRKRGHCEYFATAMAIMLRTLGIPSRVVTGFHGGEFNSITDQYVIRARDAHAWVEVFFPGQGWATFDPTPGGSGETGNAWDRASLYMDALSSFWREWVVNFDANHQNMLGQMTAHSTRSTLYSAYLWGRKSYQNWIKSARRFSKSINRSPLRWAGESGAILLGLLLLVSAGRIRRFLVRRRLAAHPQESPVQAASIWYERMTRTLARRGWPKSPAQTPKEFAGSIADVNTRHTVNRFTERYERARFGASPEDAEQLPEMYEEVSASVRK